MENETELLLKKYAERVLFWNQKVNLTGAQTSHVFFEEHILDCWAAQQALSLNQGLDQDLNQNWIDVGSGAGLPGIVWAIARPQERFILVESLQKRASFLQHIVAEFKLSQVQVENQRFENFASSFSPSQRISSEKIPLEGMPEKGVTEEVSKKIWNCVSRGTASPQALWNLAAKTPLNWTYWYVFSSQKTHEEFEKLGGRQNEIEVSDCLYSSFQENKKDSSKKVLTKLIRKVN